MLVQQERTKPRHSATAHKQGADPPHGKDEDDKNASAVKIDFKTAYLRCQLLRKDPGLLSQKRILSELVSDNLPKLVILGLVLLSVLIGNVICNRGDSSALLCVHSGPKSAEKNPYPEVDFKKVHKVVDVGKFHVVKADKWIVVTTSDSFTEQVQAMVKMQGWQVVAVGDTYRHTK